MTPRRARALAGGSFAVSALLCAGAAVVLVLGWDTPLLPNEFGVKGYGIAFSLVIGGVGAVIAARRPANPIGWIFCGLGVVGGVLAFATEYARWALIDQRGRPPAGLSAAWVEEWLWIPLIGGLGIVAAIFPDGRFLSAAWRRATWGAAGVALIPTVLNALIPRLTIYEGFDNPVGAGGDAMMTFAQASIVLLIPLMVVGTAAAVRRLRRSRGEERLQLKWLVLAMSFVASMFVLYGVLVLILGTASPSGLNWLEYLTVLSFLTVPVSIAFGILKYRLYDIDIVINRAVVYGALAVFISLVYVAIVAGVGAALGSRSNPWLSAAAAAVVALAFQPARRRAQHLANRLVYGNRATPYEVLSELSSRFAGTYSLEDALPRLARVTAEAVGAERSWVWLRSGDELHPAASWPNGTITPFANAIRADPPAFGAREAGFPVRHQGELLGAITVEMPASEPLGPAQGKLLGDVAAQAGLVLRNVALLEDLRASRKRIVTAQDERARTLERNIHDGAQQQLVALSVKLRLAQGLVSKDPDGAVSMLEDLRGETQAALENLRDLARGIYPPLLADKGLRDAIEAQARKAELPVRVEGDGIGRYPQDVEAAVYFCALEALQNVAKYAAASAVGVRLAELDGRIEFEIRDDGAGFDPVDTPRGSGLQNMADRLEALGGSLELRSAPGSGTTVAGWVPIVRELSP
ncbi:MAG: histidine kinase [Actinomycetota bacterium]